MVRPFSLAWGPQAFKFVAGYPTHQLGTRILPARTAAKPEILLAEISDWKIHIYPLAKGMPPQPRRCPLGQEDRFVGTKSYQTRFRIAGLAGEARAQALTWRAG